MTKQEIFDTVALHLIKQGKQSADATGDCFYRSPDGLKCAVGCLIPDEVYRPEMEGKNIYQLIDKKYLSLKFFQRYHILLTSLQTAHDALHPKDMTWKDAVILSLRRIAKSYNISAAVLDV
jgi:hypothetical protein